MYMMMMTMIELCWTVGDEGLRVTFTCLFVLQTREEKKLEAIMKAFERMEKREQHQRKKEAQLEQSKRLKEKSRDTGGAGTAERDTGKYDGSAPLVDKTSRQDSSVCSGL